MRAVTGVIGVGGLDFGSEMMAADGALRYGLTEEEEGRLGGVFGFFL